MLKRRTGFMSFGRLQHCKSLRLVFFLVLYVSSVSVSGASEQPDKSKYITVNEIESGMTGYCLTCLKGTEAEKFDLEVVSIVFNMNPGRDAILVKVNDERFIHAGVIAGCSGSPVYIDSRLAGAMAFGWSNSKDPIYGVTPIEYMLKAGKGNDSQKESGDQLYGNFFDYSRPINFAEVDRQFKSFVESRSRFVGGMPALRCPIAISGLSGSVVEQLDSELEPFGLMAVSGPGGGLLSAGGASQNRTETKQSAQLKPGASLLVPLVTGDMTMTVTGTTTEVVGDDVYGFGHSFLGYGPVDLPMATGEIHTVIASRVRSFKIASMHNIVGALKADEAAAIIGRIGAEAYMFPMTVKVDRYNDTEQRTFNCRLAYNRLLTPSMIGAVIRGAALYLGDLPLDNMLEYKVSIDVDGIEPITFENVSTGIGFSDVFIETVNSIRLFMNNPFKEVRIGSINADIRIRAKDISSHIWSVQLSDSKVKAGQQVDVEVILESVLSPKKRYQYNLKIPENLKPGKYDLVICGAGEYLRFLKSAVPYRFVAKNFETLIEAMREILAMERDKLYCILVLPPGGIVLERAELSDLPATKSLILGDAKRTLATQPYQHWIEKSLKTGTIITDRKVLNITVEE